MGAMSAQGRRSYRPGGWFGIFGDNATVLLPPSEKARVAALWELVDDGAGFDETLDALLSTGLRDLPGFVLVSPVEAGTKVVLRGPAVAVFECDDQTVEVAGSTETTWVERLLLGVTRMSVQVEAGADEAEPLAIGSGLVRLARVDEPPAVDEPERSPESEHPREPEADPPSEVPAEELAEPAYVVPVPAEQDDSWTPAPEGDHPTELMESPVAEEVAVEEPVVEEPVAVEAVDPDDSGGWPAVPAAQHRAAADHETPVARLHFSSGEVVDVDRMVLVGRAPEARRYTLSDEPLVVQVASPHQEISATHLEVRPGSGPDRGSAVVTDLGSTNGTVLIQPGGVPEDLHPGIAVTLVPGAIIDLGDGVSIQVAAI
jgi:hypothetical protein